MDLTPLFGLRVRTPRLELRLPTHNELGQLREVAVAGVHPPEQMPFAVAWTDEPYSEDFVVKHFEDVRARWQPDDWTLDLGVWHEGQLMGMQGIGAKTFATSRTVLSGSWLGQRHQGQGFGTEMRAAVVELAFRGLGAERATSGWLEGNEASRRVSEKLGYRVCGTEVVQPRGVPVTATKVELLRRDWRPPCPIKIEGLAPALPLFGLEGQP